MKHEERYEDQKELGEYTKPLNSDHDFAPKPIESDTEKETHEDKKEISDNTKEKLGSEHDFERSPTKFLPEYEKKELGRNETDELNHEPVFEHNPAEFVSEHKEQTIQNSETENIDFLIVTKIPKDTRHFLWTINEFSNLPVVKELYSPGIYRLYSSWCRLKLVKNERGFCLYHVNTL
ncbi:hypothetical protein AVEN_227488-1 [Araneus ventricosus]|uniref:Uncharacterized protein n=1 Tax=Araneus ventricosus TaxID=182803 RepID=A0A4Y2C3C2_ARAVE|nr:hypothetical protein AVEN_227488-1 [Araneus ventricosus]